MMHKHVVMPLFSIPIYISNIEITNNIRDKIREVPLKRINVNNGDLSISSRILDDLNFQDIKSKIINHIDIYTKEILSVADYINFNIQNSWIMRHTKGDYSHTHIHTNSLLSGIVYIEVDDNSGDIVFQKDSNYTNLFPPAIDVDVKERNIFNSKTWEFTPKSGQIFIFPSNLSHSVNESKSDNLRYCLSFNLFPSGTLGLNEGEPLSILNLS